MSGRCGDNAMRLSIETDRHVPFSCRKGAYGDGVCWLANRFVLNENSFKVPAGVLQKACVDFAAQFDSTAAAMTFVERCFQ